MEHNLLSLEEKPIPLFKILLWGLLFALTYGFVPLYASNQNTYFLHGLVKAGFGFLADDWMAQTTDPFPLFSYLIYLTYRYLQEFLFYVYWILICIVYFYSLWGIADYLFALRRSSIKSLVFITCLIAIHSPLIENLSKRVGFERLFGLDLSLMLVQGLACQHILGRMFLPSMFGVGLIFSIYLFLKQRTAWAVFFAVVAASFHSSYLLGAASLTIAYMYITWKEKKSWLRALGVGSGAFLLILPVLTYDLFAFYPSTPEIYRQAQDILAHYRFPHHALPERWLDLAAYIRIGIIIISLILLRKTRLFPILFISLAIGTILTLIQMATGNLSLALLFPWRISAYLMPIATVVITARLITFLGFHRDWEGKKNKLLKYSCITALTVFCVSGIAGMILMFVKEGRYQVFPIMNYVKAHKTTRDLYLVPIEFDRFRLYTGASIYIDNKSHPYKDVDVVEWYAKIKKANQIFENKTPDCNEIKALSASDKITHVILEQPQTNQPCDFLKEIYRDKKYCLYQVNKSD